MTSAEFQFHMRPEWNSSQHVEVEGHTTNASASPYDVPNNIMVSANGGAVHVGFRYDMMVNEPMNVLDVTPNVQMMLGQETGRLLTVHVRAADIKAATALLRVAADALASLRKQPSSTQSIRRSVHLGMLQHALPEMGQFIETRLRELRGF